jgi:preprotein translocase subunit SecF
MINLRIIEGRRWYLLAAGILVVLSAAALIVSAALTGLPLQIDTDGMPREVLTAAGFGLPISAAVAMLFVWWSSRDMPDGFRYAACAITLIAHNLLVLLGFSALMGLVAGWRADTLFFAATLAIVALTTIDAVASFDRIRSNATKRRLENRSRILDRSTLEMLVPMAVVRLCLLFILVPIAIVGGPIVSPFAITLLVGVVAETYASVFVAIPLLTI